MPTPDFVYDLPELLCSESSFAPHIPCGATWKASFSLRAEDDSPIEGMLVSDQRRIIPATDNFSGTTPEIVFGIDTAGLRVEDTIEGQILISSNLGEKSIPIHAQIVEAPDEDFDPEIKALEDFEQLCRRNLREGFRLFTHPAFPHILNGKNVVYLPLYRGMSQNPVTYQHLEEFLIASGKKEPIRLSLDKQQKAVYHLDVSQKDTLYIYKNNWGYIHVAITVEGDFLEVKQADLTSEDFIGDVCGLEYLVHRDRIRNGKAFGCIRLRTVHQELVYEIEASSGDESEIQPRAVRSRRISWLMRDFLKLQMHELDYRTWQDSSAMTVGELLEEDSADLWAVLYAAYLHYAQDDNAGAMETLWPIKEGALSLENREQQALYLWISKRVGLLPAENRNILPMLRRSYEKQPDSYLLLYLLQQESNEGVVVPAERLKELEQCFDAGCSSPFLYWNAWEMLQKEEALLRELSPFLTQVLCFGQRQGRMTAGLLKRAAHLSAEQKQYHAPIFRLLTRGYQTFPEDAVLEAICQMLVKGDPIRNECFPWYERAVERDIRMTRLYEYYMETYTRPAEETIPQAVRMYFATNNTLGASKKALLYASVILHKEDDPTGYTNYAKNMRSYALASLEKGRIDKNYAVLYQHFFSRPETPEIAALVTRVLFIQRVTVSNKEIRQVMVCHNALKKETIYPCRDGVAYPRIYSEDACLLFEDDQHRRFATTVSCTREPMFAARDIAQACMYQAIDDAGLELYLCREKAFQMDVNGRTWEDYRMAEKNPAFTDAYRQTVRRKMLEYALHHFEERSGEEWLTSDQIDTFAEADRAGTAQFLIRDGRYEEAFRIISKYGFEGIPLPLLQECVDHRIADKEDAYEEELLYLSAHLFAKDTTDPTILDYLCRYYRGSLADLCRLWEKMRSAELDPLALEEKILHTAVRTRQIPDHAAEILEDQLARGKDPAVTETYLCYRAGQYFLGGLPMERPLAHALEAALQDDRLEEDICKLAFLKDCSEQETHTDEQKELGRKLLQEQNRKGHRFAFYQALPVTWTEGLQTEDKGMIDAQFHPEARVVLRYRIQRNHEKAGEWISEPMPQVYNGIFHQEFLLFSGDTLWYDLRVMMHGAIESTETQMLSKKGPSEGYTRYAQLNRMLEAKARGDREAFLLQERAYAQQLEASLVFLPLLQGTPERIEE